MSEIPGLQCFALLWHLRVELPLHQIRKKQQEHWRPPGLLTRNSVTNHKPVKFKDIQRAELAAEGCLEYIACPMEPNHHPSALLVTHKLAKAAAKEMNSRLVLEVPINEEFLRQGFETLLPPVLDQDVVRTTFLYELAPVDLEAREVQHKTDTMELTGAKDVHMVGEIEGFRVAVCVHSERNPARVPSQVHPETVRRLIAPNQKWNRSLKLTEVYNNRDEFLIMEEYAAAEREWSKLTLKDV